MAELVDPQAEFEAHPKDYALSWYEEQQVDKLASQDYATKAAVAAGLGAAFLLYRSYMKRTVAAHMKREGSYSYSALDYAMSVAYVGFLPSWMRMGINQVTVNYVMGLADSIGSDVIPPELLYDTAEQYVARLGDYMNTSTKETVLKGYQAQVNRQVIKQRAVANVVDALGSSNRAMNTLVNLWTAKKEKKLTDQRLPDVSENTAQRLIQADITARAKVLGQNESEVQQSQIQQIVWMYSADKGIIPKDTKRTWQTAKDEKVCAVCGPMDDVSIPVHEKFNLKGVKLWSPPAHPGCRCKAELRYDYQDALDREIHELVESEPVAKSRGSDPYDRDSHGRFASRESRQPKTFKVAEANPALERIQRMYDQAKQGQLEDFMRGPELSKPKLEGPKLEGPKLSGPTLSRPKLAGPELSKPVLGNPEKPTLGGASLGGAKLSSSGARLSAADIELVNSATISNAIDINPGEHEDVPESIMSQGRVWDRGPVSMATLVPARGDLGGDVRAGHAYDRDFGDFTADHQTIWHMLPEDDHDVYDQSYGLGNMIQGYWNNQESALLEHYQAFPGDFGGSHIDYQDHTLYVTEEAFLTACDYYVTGNGGRGISINGVPTVSIPDYRDEYDVDVPVDVILDQLNLRHTLYELRPTIITTDYASDDLMVDADGSAMNQGEWTAVTSSDAADPEGPDSGSPKAAQRHGYLANYAFVRPL